MSLDQRLFRDTLGLFVTGVTVVTTKDSDGQPLGVTVNSFNSVSLDPPLILWSLAKASGSLAAFTLCGHFAVHVLRLDQINLSDRFARPGRDDFSGVSVQTGLGGVPILNDCAARFECRIHNTHPAGDHVIFIGEVARTHAEISARPLLYHGGKYVAISDKQL